MGNSVGSFDGINYGKRPVSSLLENILNIRLDAEIVGSIRDL